MLSTSRGNTIDVNYQPRTFLGSWQQWKKLMGRKDIYAPNIAWKFGRDYVNIWDCLTILNFKFKNLWIYNNILGS
jgi:hypothetical protein